MCACRGTLPGKGKELLKVNKGKKPLALPEAGAKQLRPELLIAGVLIALSVKLYYVGYTYKGKYYSLKGTSLMEGRTICGGKVVLPPNFAITAILIAGIVIALSGVLTRVLTVEKGMLIALVASIAALICNIYFASSIAGAINKAKGVRVTAGSILALAVTAAVLLWLLIALYKLKVLSALDFMAVPGMLYFIINNYIPMVGIAIAFKKIDYSVGILQSPWVGFSNFRQLFATSTGSFFDSDAWLITKNTFAYNIVFIILGTVVGIIVGICLADIGRKFLQKFFQTSILLPQLISYVIVAYIVFAFFSNDAGLVNHILGEEKAINFYAAPKYWPFILTFIYIWKQVGYNAIIFLSSIVGIDRSIYEAAKVDGATKWNQIRYITLPLLKPTVITLFMLSVGRIMYSDFGLFYQVPLDSGALYSVTQTIDTYVYRCLMTLNNIAVSSAASTYQAIIGFILVLIVNSIVRRVDKSNALF